MWLTAWHKAQSQIDKINDLLPDRQKEVLQDRSWEEGASYPAVATQRWHWKNAKESMERRARAGKSELLTLPDTGSSPD